MTLYERIGGEAGIAALVDEFYLRVMNDSELRPFFEGVSLERLKTMQREFFAAALDGPMDSSDRDIAAAHQGLGIRRRHVTRFVDHLLATLEQRAELDTADVSEIIHRIAVYADEVIELPSGDDG